jgi:hypothetical protein
MTTYGHRGYPLGCDAADISTHGFKTSIGGKSYFRGRPNVKAARRRVGKRLARAEGKAAIKEGLL